MANLPPFFGLNIGRDKIKLAQIKFNSPDQAKLEALGSVGSSVSLVANESEEGATELANVISNCVKSSGVTTKNCVIAISELAVFSRLLTLPKVSEDEVEESIHYAIKPLIPVPIDDVNISFLKVSEAKTDNGEMVNWYTVAAPKIIIDRYTKIIEKAGLHLLAIETEPLSIVRSVFFSNRIPEGKNVMIIDIGAESTNMIIAMNSAVVFSQTINTGSNSMTKVIASDFGIDEAEAEKYKIAYGLDFSAGDGKIAKSIQPIVQMITDESSRTLTYLRERIGGDSISSIYLTGGGSSLKGLDSFMKEKLSLDIIPTDTLMNIDIDPKLAQQLGTSGGRQFNVAVGLALKTY